MFLARVLISLASLTLVSTAIAGGTITNVNAQYTYVGVPVFSTNLGDGTLLTDAPGSPDHLYKNTWYYRSQNNNTNRVFSSLDTPTESYVGNTATFQYTNAGPGVAGGGDRFDAQLVTTLTDGEVDGSSQVQVRVRFKNLSTTATRRFELFNIVDLDIAGTAGDDTLGPGATPGVFQQTESGSANFAQITATPPTRVQIGTGTALRAVTASITGNFTNSTTPVTGDAGLGMQWTLNLAPLEEVTLYVVFAINGTAALPAVCDTVDFNGDSLFPDTLDIEDFISVFGGGPCSTGTCGDIDFNNDGLFPDTADINALLNVFSGGACT